MAAFGTRLLRAFARRPPRLAFTWQLAETFGWGLVGVHLALYLAELGELPIVFKEPGWESFREVHRKRLRGLEGNAAVMEELLRLHEPNLLTFNDRDVLHCLGTQFVALPVSARVRGRRNIGLIAFEETSFPALALERARSYDQLIVHSTYNRELLQPHGLADVRLAFQGIDPSEMRPLPRAGRFPERFVVFSGGKLEHRKGHDLVISAFKRFHARHPEALLAVAWHNIWPQSAMALAASPWTPVPPQLDGEGQLRIRDWALANGVPGDAFVDLGQLRREEIAPTFAECDAAIFPNRCEGATNLVAMEAMACGVPVVLSANTGHLDIIHEERCLVLREQKPMPDAEGRTIGWGESSVDELVEHLEKLYTDRAAAQARVRKALEFVRSERTWRRFAETLVAQL